MRGRAGACHPETASTGEGERAEDAEEERVSPYAPARACRVQGCRHVVTHDTPCSDHPSIAGYRWGKAGQQTARLNGHQNTLARKRLFARHPLCVMCEAEGRTSAAVIRDHIVPLAEGGTEDDANCQGLCQAHHDAKTHEESMRGQGRNR